MKPVIVILENDEAILNITTFVLQEDGFTVLGFKDFVSVDHLLSLKPDLIILDEWLDGVYGHNICNEIKLRKGGGDIPVILMSAVTGLAEIANRCNADGYIVKPFELTMFETTIKNILRNKIPGNE